MEVDRSDPQETGQMALDAWTKDQVDESAGYMADCVKALAAAGDLKKESADADLLAWLQNPIVNIIACQNTVIQGAVDNWKAAKGDETLSAI